MAATQGILLKNGRIIDPANGIDMAADVLIENGKIVSVTEPGKLSGNANAQQIDVAGCWVVPGLIDMHVHLREPGEEYKETILSGTRAASAGGFTAVACMPNTDPVNDCSVVTRMILEKSHGAYARVYPVGTISKSGKGEALAEIGDMKSAGIVAISDDGRPVSDSQLMRRALEYSGNFDLPVICHSEDMYLSRTGVMNEGALSTKLGLKGIPSAAEEIMVYRDIKLAEYTGRPVHIAHASTRESINLIRSAKEKGSPVTAETAPHYFSLTEKAVEGYNTNAKMNPPLRTEEDVASIKEALADGTLDVIATDHAPHSTLEKEVEFDVAANGIIGLETAVPLTLNLVREGVFDEAKMVELLSVNPAKILKVDGGSISEGSIADITVINPEKEFQYTIDKVVSKSKNSPFLGRQLKGMAVLTIVGGDITFSSL